MKPVYHTNKTTDYRLFIMLGDRKTLGNIIMPLEMARRKNELNNASQIEKVIDNHASGLPLYGVITVSKDNTNDTYRYQKSAKIDREGIYFTLLVYAPVTNFN